MSKNMGETSPEDDFNADFAAAFGRLQVSVLEACGGEEVWPAKVCAAVGAAVDFAAADPAAARLLAIESLARRPQGGNRYLRMVEHFADLLRAEVPADERRPERTEAALVGGVTSLVADHLRGGTPEQLRALAPELAESVLVAYMSRGEARRWARRLG